MAGSIHLHREVVALSGTVALWVALVCVLTVLGLVGALAALVLVALVLGPYLLVLGLRPERQAALPIPAAWSRWLASAIHEEETDLDDVVRARRGTRRDALVAVAMLALVVAASTLMETGATTLGTRFKVADIITGGLILAVVTSLPNAVAAVYLAARGRGAAVLSTALNSNALNIAVGLLVPAAITGIGPSTGQGILVAAWYAGLTALALALAYRHRALHRLHGGVIIGGYLVFVAALLASTLEGTVSVQVALLPALAAGAAGLLVLARPADLHAGYGRLRAAAAAYGRAVRRAATQPAWVASIAVCLAVARSPTTGVADR